MARRKEFVPGGWRRSLGGELSAEFLGTFVMIAFGEGVVAMAVAALNQSGRGAQIFAASGDWLLITWGWALAVTFGVYIAGAVSGAHLNPAITIALALRRGFPGRKVLPYILAQTLGAFCGAAVVYLNSREAIASFEGAHNIVRGALGGAADSSATFSIFATAPAPYYGLSLTGPFIDQIIGTMFLVLVIFALTDTRNQPPQSNLSPIVVGLVVAGIGMSFGANAGYAINPARDFGPRLFAWLAGWGKVAFPGTNGYFWVPLVGPVIGALIGAVTYDMLIRSVLEARGEPSDESVEARGRTVKQDPVSSVTE